MESESKKLSEIILDAMRAKNLTIEKLVQMTGVSDRFLNLILEEKFEQLPAAPYVRGGILKIANVLNLDGEELWRNYLKNNEAIPRSGKNDNNLSQNRFKMPQLGKKLIIALIVAVIILYLLFRLPAILGQPTLILDGIENNMVITSANLEIKGRVGKTDQLTINNELVYPDKEGYFTKTIFLTPGFNTLTFRVKKMLGSEKIFVKQVFYENPKSTNESTINDNKKIGQ